MAYRLLIAVIGLALFLPLVSLHAQYTQEAIDLQKAGDLFDERGFAESSTISVDGNLVVSNSTGVPSYSYPISSHTISGYPIEVTLNYAGSVQHTAFSEFNDAANLNLSNLRGMTLEEREPYLDNTGPFRWERLTENRPEWIVGVNGFAIQVLHNAVTYHPNPKVVTERHNDDEVDQLEDKDFVWLVDGYDFSNTMTNFVHDDEVEDEIDVIRLLRADGSVLELINSTEGHVSDEEVALTDKAYSGTYAVNEPNAQGFAIVEYDPEYWPEYMQTAHGVDDPDSEEHGLVPRKVRYFPGDGLEYIFREWVMPYGSYATIIKTGENNRRFGTPYSAPSIFYLDELRSAAGHLTSFTRSRHYPPEKFREVLGRSETDPPILDSTRGRALITDFDGHHFEYMDNAMIVTALGRTTKIEFHLVGVDGSDEEAEQFEESGFGNTHLAEYGYFIKPGESNPNIQVEILAKTTDDFNQLTHENRIYRSYSGMITRIIDPMGRVTTFDYDRIKRLYEVPGFPQPAWVGTAASDLSLHLHHFRLKEVVEPTAHYDLCYKLNQSPETQNWTEYYSCEETIPHVLMVYRDEGPIPPAEPRDIDPYAVNDIVYGVTKSFCGEALSKSTYEFEIVKAFDPAFGYEGNYTNASEVTHFDHEEGEPISAHQIRTEFYRSPFLQEIWPVHTKKRYTGTTRIIDSYHQPQTSLNAEGYPVIASGTGILETDTYTAYPTALHPDHPLLVLPTYETVTVDNILKTRTEYEYGYETARRYYYSDGVTEITDRTNKFGDALLWKKSTLMSNGSNEIVIEKTDYLNIPYDADRETSVGACGEWDKFATLANYFATYPNNERRWEDVMYEPGILAYLDQDNSVFPIPPVFGLTKEVAFYDPAVMDPTGVNKYAGYLGGKEFSYLGDADNPLGTVGQSKPQFAWRLKETRQVGKLLAGETTPMTIETEKLTYALIDCRVLPLTTTNANGVSTRLVYGVDSLVDPKKTWMHNNDSATRDDFAPNRYFSVQFETPIATTQTVRKTDVGDIETLETYNEPTYYGLTLGAVDPNGWYSRFDYDYNGRVRRAILPYDFRAKNTAVPYIGTEEIPIHGYALDSSRAEDLVCHPENYSPPYEYVTYDWVAAPFALRGDPLTAKRLVHPRIVPTECPCVTPNEIYGVDTDAKSSTPQTTCAKTIPNVIEEKRVVSIPYWPSADDPSTPGVNETSPLRLVTALQSAELRLTLLGMVGECITVRITCPELGMDQLRLFGLDCIIGGGGGGSEDRTEKVDEGYTTQSDPSCPSQTEVYGEDQGYGLNLSIPLDTEELLAYGQSFATSSPSALTFTFEVLTPNGSISFANGAEDSRPRLVLNGTFSDTRKDDIDYTLMVTHDDENLTSTFSAKVDDYRHTENSYYTDPADPASFNDNPLIPHAFTHTGPSRYAEVVNRFGADYRVMETEAMLVDAETDPLPPSVVAFEYTGNGLTRGVIDQIGNRTETDYDVAGRAVATTMPGIDVHNDATTVDGVDDDPGIDEVGSVSDEYIVTQLASGQPDPAFPSAIAPAYDDAVYGPLDLSGQTFDNLFLGITASTDETGIHSLSVTDYRGNLRREAFNVWDHNGWDVDRHVRYDYDILNRLTTVTNPEGQVTTYAYDRFGRVTEKTQPDMGTTSYAYDDVGNVRFSQTQKQYEEGTLTFYQYDDMNRLTLVGEAQFDPIYHEGGGGGEMGADEKGTRTAGFVRYTEQLEEQADYLHTSVGNYLTYNPTVWQTVTGPGTPAPKIKPEIDAIAIASGCPLTTMSELESTPPPPPSYLLFGVRTWDPVAVPNPATLANFEHVAMFPNHPRMAVHYDELPPIEGDIWGGFPAHSQWEQLMPWRPDWFDEDNNPTTTTIQKVNNLRGREAAVAYREHSGEPYHYTVTSYDARGRVEAVVHYTENVGFDAVYYEYNSMNMVTRLRVVDPFRQHTTWYAYDHNGRLDSVWSRLTPSGSGLSGLGNSTPNAPRYPTASQPRPLRNRADIVYTYDERGLVDAKTLQPQLNANGAPGLAVSIDYEYNERGWMTDMSATRASANLFDMTLEYDLRGQIVKQTSQHGANAPLPQHYDYDEVRQITNWKRNGWTTAEANEIYHYDRVGNRLVTNMAEPPLNPNELQTLSYPMGTWNGQPAPVNNRLATIVRTKIGVPHNATALGYDPNGAVATRTTTTPVPGMLPTIVTETFAHSYRGLLWGYGSMTTANGVPAPADDWRYRYNPRGEREGKRLYDDAISDFNKPYPWVYYALDAKGRQVSLWRGQQTSNPQLCPTAVPPPGATSWRFMYPSEYLSYGLGTSADIVTKPNAVKTFKLSDHLGSTRVEITEGGATASWDYEPYGDPVAGANPPRTGFIDREEDGESGLGDFGVRKYDSETGRFLSTDPLWEEYRGWTPYQYALNSPLDAIDPEGDSVVIILDKQGAILNVGHIAMLIGNDKDGWYYYSKDGTEGQSGTEGAPDYVAGKYFSSLEKFAQSKYNKDEDGKQRYDVAFLLKSTSKKDEKMKATARKEARQEYRALDNNCMTMVLEALDAGGFDTGNFGTGNVTPIPRFRFNTLKNDNGGKGVTSRIKRR